MSTYRPPVPLIMTMLGSAIVVLAALLAPSARSHEPGTEWMMDGRYKSGTTNEHCCSPHRDCQPVPDSDLELTPKGWRYLPTGELIPEKDTFRSRDLQGRHWRCAGTLTWWPGGHRTQRTRCLFVAPGTT